MSDELVLQLDPPYAGSAVSPTVDITETTTDVTVTITDFRGEHSYSVEKTDQAIEDAEAAADNANTAAANATSTANAAAQYARDTADQAAADAQETADEAAGRADAAAASATQAAQAATTAAGTANTSAQNADAKAAVADSKATLANQAATTANNAAQAAEAAKTAANTAAGQATTAAGQATTAAQIATTAATNADTKAALADTAATNADTATANANTATTAATNAAQAANNAADYAIEAVDDMPKLVNTASGTTAQTVNDAWLTTLHGATVYGKSVQNGTPTPDNPVPVQVVEPLNLLGNLQPGTYTQSGIMAIVEDNNIVKLSGTATGGGSLIIPFVEIVPIVHDGRQVYAHNRNDAINTSVGLTLQPGTSPYNGPNMGTFSPVNRIWPISMESWNAIDTIGSIRLYIPSSMSISGTLTCQPSIEYTDAITTFMPCGYIGLQIGETVTPIDLEGHVLAGLQNNVRDELDIDAAGVKTIGQRVGVVDLGTLTWTYDTSTARFIASITSKAECTAAADGIRLACANYAARIPTYFSAPSSSFGADVMSECYSSGHRQQIMVADARYTDAATFKAAMSGVLLYYELATPVTHSLGTMELPELTQPCELAFYASLNPEWAIKYTQDPNVVISTLTGSIAPIEGSIASTNYAVGTYLIHANQLYRVTSAIATGEAITPGSNCVSCTVMGELARLTA